MSTQSVERRTPQDTPAPNAAERTRQRRVFTPRVDILEGEKEIVVVADMPGADEKNVSISLEKSVLTLTARIPEHAPTGHSTVHREYDVGDFERSFTLSEAVDQDRIQARVKDGVLRLILPKAAPAQARRIAVRAG